jgi:hypothetical protein
MSTLCIDLKDGCCNRLHEERSKCHQENSGSIDTGKSYRETECRKLATSIKKEYLKDQMIDQYQTEAMYAQLVVRLSDILVFLVNEYTWVEQRRVMDYHYEFLEKGRLGKRVAVVHNLKDVVDYSAAYNITLERISGSVAGSKVNHTKMKLAFIEEWLILGEGKEIRHFGLCKEGSKCGNDVNKDTFTNMENYLRQIVTQKNLDDPTDIYDRITSTMCSEEVLDRFVRLVEDGKSGGSQKRKTTKPTRNNGKSLIDCKFVADATPYPMVKVMATENGNQIATKSDGEVNEHGELMIVKPGWTMKPIKETSWITTENGDKYLIIEVPGVDKNNVNVQVSRGIDSEIYTLQVTQIKSFDDDAVVPYEGRKIHSVHGTDVLQIVGDKWLKGYQIPVGNSEKSAIIVDKGILALRAEKN